MQKTIRGFTIVELLIVIVVIAVLAAIAIVAYNGIQTRAQNTTTTKAVSEYVRAIAGYAAIHGSYPTANFACLGTPAGGICGNTTDSLIGACGGNSARGTTLTNFETALQDVLKGSGPNPSTQTLTCSNKVYTGAHYYSASGKTAWIGYYLRGDQICGDIGGLNDFGKYQTGDITVCGAELPDLP